MQSTCCLPWLTSMRAQLSRTLAAEWQHPFVSIFKICDVEEWKHVGKDGNVVAVLVRPFAHTHVTW